MNPFSILQVSKEATQSEVMDAYERLKAEYSEKRFSPGLEGAEACRKLEQIEEAYREATSLISASYDIRGGNKYQSVEDAIRAEDIEKAQMLLDNISIRDAEWNYYQAIVFYKKNWHREAIKQLEMALASEPHNSKYKDSLNELKSTMLFGQDNPKDSFYGAGDPSNNYGGRSYREQPVGAEQSYCCSPCGICQGLLCADCCCECMGGDLIACC